VLTEKELMSIHVQTLFTHDSHSRLLSVNEPVGGAPAPRFFFFERARGTSGAFGLIFRKSW